MNYQTELMRAILTNHKAQEIIDHVSPVYGESYVGLWIFQAIGTVLGGICEIAEQMRYEANPATARLLLDYWEDHYNIPKDTSLTAEQRQLRLIVKTQSRAPANPERLATAVSAALGGVEVKIFENISKNKFLVNIRDVVDSINPAVAVLERMKPAHLIYEIQMSSHTVTEAELKIAIAVTHAEQYKVEVLQ